MKKFCIDCNNGQFTFKDETDLKMCLNKFEFLLKIKSSNKKKKVSRVEDH